jgi:hypothetical protein
MTDAQITFEVAKGLALKLLESPQVKAKNLPPLVDKAVKAYQDGQAEKILEMLSGDFCPYTKQDVILVLLENLSSQDRDPRTGQKKEPEAGTPERARYDKAQEVADAMRVYLESSGQQIPSALIDELVVYVSHMPQYRDILYDKNGQLRKQEAKFIAQNLLRQPQYRRIIHRIFTERLDPKKRLEHESIVTALEREIKQLEAQIIDPQKIETEIAQKKSELAQKNAAIMQDQNYGDYLNLLGQLEAAQEELKTFQEIYKQARINNTQQLQQITQDINNKKQEIRNLQRSLSDQRFSNIYQLEQEVSSLQASIQSLEQQKQQVNTPEQKQLRVQLQEKLLQLQDAKAQLIAERIKYASDIIATPKEAARDFFNEALGEAANYYKEEAKKAAEKEEADRKRLEEQAIEKLGRRLGRKEKKKGGEKVPVPDKKQARRLLTLLFKPSGLQGFIDEVAKNQKTLIRYGLTKEEADAILAKKSDPQFVETVGQNLAKKVLCDYLLAGGRLSRDYIFAIANTDWGKSIIEDGLRLSQEQKEFLESQLGKGVLKTLDEIKGGKTTGEWLKSNWLKIAGIFALVILFGLIGPSVSQWINSVLTRG